VAAVRLPDRFHPAVSDRPAHCPLSGSAVAAVCIQVWAGVEAAVVKTVLTAQALQRYTRLIEGTPTHHWRTRQQQQSSPLRCLFMSNCRRLPKRHPGSCIDLFGFDVMFDTALKPYALRSDETLASLGPLSVPHQFTNVA
jgi:hypothetical protein